MKCLIAGVFVALFSVEAMAAGCLKASPLSLQRKAATHAASIDLAVKKYRVDKELIQAVIAVESCFRRKAVSPAGAQGLMQLMPATADRFGVKDSFNAKQNILAAKNNTIADGAVYYPYPPIKKVAGRVQVEYQVAVEKPIAITAKPGRQGLDFMKSRAPHLYKKP